MGKTLTREVLLVSTECPTCGVEHAYPQRLDQAALDEPGPNGRSIYCPNGHGWFYTGKSEAQKAREERDRAIEARDRARSRVERVEAERDRIERQRRATAGHLTRAKRRIALGVCPCCTEKFDDLAAHMSDRHPDYVEPRA